MRDGFLARRLLSLGLNANVARPPRSEFAAIPAFFAGWLAGELAPQALTVELLDTAQHLLRRGVRGRDLPALAVAAVNVAANLRTINAGERAKVEIEDALRDGLGANYADVLQRPHTPGELATSWRSVAAPWRMRQEAVTVRRHLPYQEGGRRYHLDVYHHRDAPAGAPVLLQIHGGGWVIGNKDQQALPLMYRMAARGWVCVSANYPLSPRARWPEHIVAVKQALAWIRTSITEYGGDPDFVAVTGGSAGGHLAALLALTPGAPEYQPGFEDVDTKVQACVPHYGVYDFTEESGERYTSSRLDSLLRKIVMAPDAVYPDDFRAASPLYRIAELEPETIPPFLVLHGSHDTLVPVLEARSFVGRLRERSANPVAYAEFQGAQHAFDIFPSIRSVHVVKGVERFLDWSYATRLSREATLGSAPQRA